MWSFLQQQPGRRSLKSKLKAGSFKSISSHEIGLPLGVYALAVKRRSITKRNSFSDRRRNNNAGFSGMGRLG